MTGPLLAPAALSYCGQRVTAYRHMWRSSLVSTVVEPALFLAAMGLTLGVLVDRGTGLPGGVSYLAFLAPGLLAATAVHERGLRPVSSLVRRSTLEDVFLRLTGRSLVE